jgi:hypothetical protein
MIINHLIHKYSRNLPQGIPLAQSILIRLSTMQSKLQPLTLHAYGTGPNPYKVAIALEAIGIPYNVKQWEFGDAPNGVNGP